MPGLLRAMAATAVISGTAQATRNAVDRRQAEKNVAAYSNAVNSANAKQVQAQPVATAAPPQQDTIAQLERLGALKAQGLITEQEFAAQKAKLLGT